MARVKKVMKWRRIAKAVRDNAGDLPQIEPYGRQLETMAGEFEDATGRQSAHAAGKQQESKRLRELEINGSKLATFVANGVRQRYGDRSEKLTEFGLQPFRGGRPPAVQPEAPEEAQVDGTEASQK